MKNGRDARATDGTLDAPCKWLLPLRVPSCPFVGNLFRISHETSLQHERLHHIRPVHADDYVHFNVSSFARTTDHGDPAPRAVFL